jgi:hypothetical protein
MRERYHCGDAYPALPDDLACELPTGHGGLHLAGDTAWTSEASAEQREVVWRAQVEAQERAAYNARMEVLGQRPPRGGLVGNRQQRRAGLRRGR